MRYRRFVELRSPIWDGFEETLRRAGARGDRLSHQELEAAAFTYRQVLHDHALAGARFPDTGTARRLRRLAQQGTRLLTRERTRSIKGPLYFFLRLYPRTFRRQLPLIGLTAALFLALALFGFVVTFNAPRLGVVFVGPGAVLGLEQGRLWTEGLTTAVAPAASSGIATNNISVGLTAFAGGALFGLGSLWVVVVNGLMLGSVVGLTLHFGMAHRLLEFVAAHGPTEITIILVCAAAGLVLARGMVEADDRPRGERLRAAAGEGLVLLGGALPWLVLLGFVEAYISPSRAFSPGFKTTVGAALFLLYLAASFNPLLAPEEAPSEGG